MALVDYSDSESSDAETNNTPDLSVNQSKQLNSADFQVDRSNPRKIRVALPETRPEHDADADNGPARKKLRLGGGASGTFSGFNSILPAPKKAPTTSKSANLKTGSQPSFDRSELKKNPATKISTPTNPVNDKAKPTPDSANSDTSGWKMTPLGLVKVMSNSKFRPLSAVHPKKKTVTTSAFQSTTSIVSTSATALPAPQQPPAQASDSNEISAPAPPKPKVSLFSMSSEDSSFQPENSSSVTGSYEPLVYHTETENPSLGPDPAPDMMEPSSEIPASAPVQSLDTIADDLNLSRADRRQLFGRSGQSAGAKVLTFNTDQEYISNQNIAQSELAAAQHNPVRSIAPGKHTLQQLVHAASSQKEALEESFAAGRRNKKEAGSRYGW
ncbi:hypothetical protein N7495_000417 [Penicillium taxi]|uniref:uncharacterized protein n=1 Tax=Penicillium taxi TaxID=168475 RepID=UPI00254587F7|nr:uncharacterized protein N7495_000417 [Penicillium taxi]KAJ5907735.1 hypothetical protein N7495_000417 [Penicillium taxi]